MKPKPPSTASSSSTRASPRPNRLVKQIKEVKKNGEPIKTKKDPETKVDTSLLRQPIDTSASSLEQILDAVRKATPEVVRLLDRECSIILECKICKNLFRSLANFLSHKRGFCLGTFEELIHNRHTQHEEVYYRKEKVLVTRSTTRKDILSFLDTMKQITTEHIVPENIVLENIPATNEGFFNLRYKAQEAGKESEETVKIDPVQTPLTNGHCDSEDNSNECSFCHNEFSSSKALSNHVKKDHGDLRVCFICPCCKKYFANTWSVHRHLYKVHRKSSEQVRKLRSQIHKKQITQEEFNRSKKGIVFSPQEEKNRDKAFMEDLQGHDSLQKCSECGKHFERKVALVAHSSHCQRKAAAPSDLIRSLKRKSIMPRKVVEEKKAKMSSSLTEEMILRLRNFDPRVVLTKADLPSTYEKSLSKEGNAPDDRVDMKSLLQRYRDEIPLDEDVLNKIHSIVPVEDSIYASDSDYENERHCLSIATSSQALEPSHDGDSMSQDDDSLSQDEEHISDDGASLSHDEDSQSRGSSSEDAESHSEDSASDKDESDEDEEIEENRKSDDDDEASSLSLLEDEEIRNFSAGEDESCQKERDEDREDDEKEDVDTEGDQRHMTFAREDDGKEEDVNAEGDKRLITFAREVNEEEETVEAGEYDEKEGAVERGVNEEISTVQTWEDNEDDGAMATEEDNEDDGALATEEDNEERTREDEKQETVVEMEEVDDENLEIQEVSPDNTDMLLDDISGHAFEKTDSVECNAIIPDLNINLIKPSERSEIDSTKEETQFFKEEKIDSNKSRNNDSTETAAGRAHESYSVTEEKDQGSYSDLEDIESNGFIGFTDPELGSDSELENLRESPSPPNNRRKMTYYESISDQNSKDCSSLETDKDNTSDNLSHSSFISMKHNSIFSRGETSRSSLTYDLDDSNYGVAKEIVLSNYSEGSMSELEGAESCLTSTEIENEEKGSCKSSPDSSPPAQSLEQEDDSESFIDKPDWLTKKINSYMIAHKKKCLLCYKTFHRVSFVRRHVAAHFNINKFKCLVNMCNFQSYLRADISNHLLKVHKKKERDDYVGRLYPKKEDFSENFYIPDPKPLYAFERCFKPVSTDIGKETGLRTLEREEVSTSIIIDDDSLGELSEAEDMEILGEDSDLEVNSLASQDKISTLMMEVICGKNKAEDSEDSSLLAV